MLRLKKSKHLKKVSLAEIREATQSFASVNCIGKGGYGMVYKGYLRIAPDSQTSILVAIKRLNEKLGQGLPEFLTEIDLLSGKKHPNLINLFGYCVEHNEKILIYEYAERGSLDTFLRDENRTHNLTWLERLKICVGAARGLHYLHNHVGKHEAIIHRDIKSANILIDENWVAKVSDLGLSTLLAGLDRIEVISPACGTFGYVEPEYAKTNIVTKESDVYSFGIVLFEVLCGRLCTRIKNNGGLFSAPSLAKDPSLPKDYYLNNSLDEIVDPSLREAMNFNSMDTFVEIAKGCLHDDRGERPPMGLVVEELEKSFNLQIRSEKVKIIFQHFDLNKDGGLNKEELGALIVATNSGLKLSTDRVFNMFRSDQEKGLTCEGLLQIYDNCDVDLDMDYEVLSLKVNLHNGKKPSFTAWERYEKVWEIFQRYDLNNDGGLDTEEIEALVSATHPNSKFTMIIDYLEGNPYSLGISKHYEEYAVGKKGLTLRGLLRIYDQRDLDLDLDFQALGQRRRNVADMHWWLLAFLVACLLPNTLLNLYPLHLKDRLWHMVLSYLKGSLC